MQKPQVHIRWNDPNYAAPAEANAAAVKEAHIESICAPLHLGKNLAIVVRQPRRVRLSPPFGLPSKSCCWDRLEIRILGAELVFQALLEKCLGDKSSHVELMWGKS